MAPPAPATLPLRDRLVRFLFRRCMKDKHLRALARRYWPVMSVTVEGHRFDLHPADNTTELRLYVDRQLEERTSLLTLMDRVRQQPCVIVDIGANCGGYAIPLGNVMAAGSHLVLFEPSPLMAQRLERNLSLNKLNDHTTLHRLALGREAGQAQLNVHARNHGQSSLRALDRSTSTVDIEVRRLIDIPLPRPNNEPIFVKIDVEGREDHVLHDWLQGLDDSQLPQAILIEMVLEDQWQLDLRGMLASRGFRITMEADGNALFER